MMTKHTFVHEGTLTSEQEKTYIHLPFDMPEKAVRLEVAYSYSDRIGSSPLLTGGNTIDLGVFDERGIDFLTAGFRGWSGSERSQFFISGSQATPGYLAGALKPGQWNVLLGLYKIGPQGCSYRVEISVTTGSEGKAISASSTAAGDLPGPLPSTIHSPWLRGELHCHTSHSDGQLNATDLLKLAHSRGMDFLAVTDHNTTACQQELEQFTDPGLILLRGMEVTTFKGHFNIWGVPGWVDYRVQRPEDMEAALQYAKSLGATTCCNHPKPYGPPWDYPEVTNFDCLEAWNGPWSGLNEISLKNWTNLLANRRQVPIVGGSDYHSSNEGERNIGTPTNWVYVPEAPNSASILEAIRQGHVSLSSEPGGAFLDLRGGEDFSIMGGDVLSHPPAGSLPIRLHCLRGAGGLVQIHDQIGVQIEQEIKDQEAAFTWALNASGSRYIRAELRDADGRLLALTNPIYLP